MATHFSTLPGKILRRGEEPGGLSPGVAKRRTRLTPPPAGVRESVVSRSVPLPVKEEASPCRVLALKGFRSCWALGGSGIKGSERKQCSKSSGRVAEPGPVMGGQGAGRRGFVR